MKYLMMLVILMSLGACAPAGNRDKVGTSQPNITGLTGTKDVPTLNTLTTAILINRTIGEVELSSLYLTEFNKKNDLPDLQFYNNNDLMSEIGVQDVGDFIRVTGATSLSITNEQVAAGEVFGPTISSNAITPGEYWSLRKDTATAKFWILFKIISYKADTSLKIQYKVMEYSYK